MDYLKILNKYKKLILIFTILVTFFSFLFAYLKPPVYNVSIAFTIGRTSQQETSDYQYDSYYAIKASELIGETIQSWFMTPSVVLEIYKEADIAPQIKDLNSFTGKFRTKKYSAQNIVLRFSERDYTTAERLSRAILKKIPEKAEKLNKNSKGETLFNIEGSLPVIVAYKSDIKIVTAVGFITGILLSLFIAYVIYYFKE